jgi:type VI secretion system protein ImpG
MQIDDNLYRAFLEELNGLEKFRLAYSGSHDSALLGRDDPDVRRMIEAIAFFSARTHMSALRNIGATRRRLFEQYFAFLLTPLPAMAMLQAEISGRFSEPVILPKNSEVQVTSDDGGQAIFRTARELRVLPVSLRKVELLPKPGKGFRLLLYLQTAYPRNDDIGSLALYLNYLNNYHASLQFQDKLRQHLQKVSVVFAEKFSEAAFTTAVPADFSFGACEQPDETENGDLSHPLQQIRTFFHFPQQELYLHVQIPPPPRQWTAFIICFDMDDKWPPDFPLNLDMFQLFTVPMVNLRQTMSQPVSCDGLHERYAVYYPDPGQYFTLHSVLGVYHIAKEGLVPLRSGILQGGSQSYEIEQSSETNGRQQTWLLVNWPEAFQTPQQIGVEALWFQPDFSARIGRKLTITLYKRKFEGVEWEVLGEMRSHENNPLVEDSEGLLQFLSLQKKPLFELREIHFLLRALGNLNKSMFHNVPALLEKCEVNSVPGSNKKGGMRRIYQAQMKEFDDSQCPLVKVFLERLRDILDVCSAEASVEMEVRVSGRDEIWRFA